MNIPKRPVSGYYRSFLIALLLGIGLFRFETARAQLSEQWHGTWIGTMHIFRQKALIDSVPVRLTIAKANQPGVLTWKTEYQSATRPMTKDYTLRISDASKGVYITDEGEGTLLVDYQFGNKLYSVFDVNGILLTATYELRGNELVFEVTSGKKLSNPTNGVSSYSVDNLQRVVYRKAP